MSYEIKFKDGSVKTFETLVGANLRDADLGCANIGGAYLTYANLKYANLEGATLYNTIGNNKEIKTIQLGTYTVNITKEYMQIGCERHSIEDWFSFDDERIQSMDDHALEWWEDNSLLLELFISKQLDKESV